MPHLMIGVIKLLNLLVILIFLILPSITFGECTQWVRCPYIVDRDNPDTRKVSLDELSLESTWQEIEVKGNQAVVCLSEQLDNRMLQTVGCQNVPRQALKGFLKPPNIPYFNHATNSIEFFDGLSGRENRERPFNERSIRRRINDSILEDIGK